ncbi:MAG: 50S ribosomal protein L10 [Ignavibacteria bacterium]|nr:50S ribosomal protein L10 [Ignavibacteria bacterium]
MNRTEKAEVIAQVVDSINNSYAVFLVDYSGINVEDISKLRKDLRKEGVEYKVIKNTLFKRALDESGKYPLLANHLKGMTGYVFSGENVSLPAKVIKKYFDDKQKFALKACYVESQYYTGDKLEELSNLPSKADIIAGIIGSVNAPASGIVGALNAVMRDLVSVIDEIAKQKAA